MTLYFIFILSIPCMLVVTVTLLHLVPLFLSVSATIQTRIHDTNMRIQIHNKHTKHTHTHCERVSLMDSEDSNFPSATKDRKPSELNYPRLTHQTRPHVHTHTHTLGCIFTCNHRHTHTSMHTLSYCDMLRITQSESRKQTERSISLR